jgi:hypothetical protein
VDGPGGIVGANDLPGAGEFCTRAHDRSIAPSREVVWQEAVAYQSSTTVRNRHPAYREIIGLLFDFTVPEPARNTKGIQHCVECPLRLQILFCAPPFLSGR